MLAGHLEETAPKGVTELTVQMGLSPVLVTGVNSVPGGIFRSLCLYSEGSPPFLPSLLVLQEKAHRGSGQGCSQSRHLSLFRSTGGRNPSAGGDGSHAQLGHRARQGSRCDLHLSLSGPRSAKHRQDRHLPGQCGREGALCVAQRGVWHQVGALRYSPREGHGHLAVPSLTGPWLQLAPPGMWASLWERTQTCVWSHVWEVKWAGADGSENVGESQENGVYLKPHVLTAWPPHPWGQEPRVPPDGVVTLVCHDCCPRRSFPVSALVSVFENI